MFNRRMAKKDGLNLKKAELHINSFQTTKLDFGSQG